VKAGTIQGFTHEGFAGSLNIAAICGATNYRRYDDIIKCRRRIEH
jgi:hypothetical protein